jgi:rhodanese-related sulfurtransferase
VGIKANLYKQAMPKRIELDELRDLISTGATVVDVLPEREYAEAHLPGALNIPLKALDAETTASLDRTHAVVVYCHDYL